ncbi:hypothetical protein BOTBODRAFT_141283 [Botryobasidium botryosum FD-172 SS1]|uniref:Fungal lipase-type domain-containing protein n=1 Tax=Botryobasidium botryosum (strain FD-172 SS1) TaxID=930990 RepID=A0A067M3F6_BOTB1|nr:hypothetical protein BOTBODRAFT_141283 [Botryobasidium botryosum FD-172 SS1]
MFWSPVVAAAALGAVSVVAAPAASAAGGGIAVMSAAAVASFTPYAKFASAAYCPANKTRTWTCGSNCQATPGFIPHASGGDGDDEQYWYVGYDPTFLEAVVVGHEGTNPHELLPLLTDGNIVRRNLDPSLFPGVPSSVEAHSGFQDAHAKAAKDVLAAVQEALAAHKTSKVILVGHSLGAAIAVLDAIYLPLHLPSSISFTAVTFGLPRIGNSAFADYVDAHAHLSHITNKADPIPTIPGQGLGFAHPNGEKHIDESNAWIACAGHDNPNTECSTGAVPTIFSANLADHDGPYDGVTMGC